MLSAAEIDQDLKQIFSAFINDAVLPGEIEERVAASVSGAVNREVMDIALERARRRVAGVIEAIPRLNGDSFALRVPGKDFLELVLLTEYIMVNSVQGEQKTLRYLRAKEEPAQETMALCLHALGFLAPGDLEPYRRVVQEKIDRGEAVWDRMVQSLENHPGR